MRFLGAKGEFMRIRRGCGCPILILGLVNLLYIVASILSLVSRQTKVAGALLVLTISLANLVVCIVVGLAAVRGGKVGASGEDAEDDIGGASVEEEGID
jgi:hypothetical protein